MIKKHIPNAITCLNLISGSMAVYYGFQGRYTVVLLFVLLSAILDFLDGFAARLLKAYSPMGKELDSLADVISFGLAPGTVAFSLLSHGSMPSWVAFAGFIIPAFSALRLAKFNIDERQTSSFIGLPTPANAIFWIGMGYTFSEYLTANSWLVLVLILVFSILLVVELPMFSLKFKNLKWSENQLRHVFLLVSIVLLAAFQLDAFAPIIVCYVILSVVALFLKDKVE